MRSRGSYLLGVAALVVVSLAVLSITIFSFNFIFFSLRLNGHGSLLSAGSRGIILFLQIFPWMWLALDGILVALLEWMLRYFRFGYRVPVLYLLIGLLLVAVPLGLILDRATPFNDRILLRADHHRLPQPLGNFYQGARHRPPGEGNCRCTIVAIGTTTMTVDDIDPDKTIRLLVVLPLGYATSAFSVGDVVFVAGDRTGNTIQAFHIHSLPPKASPPHSDRK